jgi:hypothetical protein
LAAAAALNFALKGEVSLRRNRLSPVVALRAQSLSVSAPHKHEGPDLWTGAFVFVGTLTMTYFRAVYPALSSARRRFTVLFGMGRRGTNALCSSEKLGGGRHAAPPSGMVLGCVFNSGRSLDCLIVRATEQSRLEPQRACGYRIKPHGQLVRLSSTHYCASTWRLSTSWSRTTLQGGPPLCALVGVLALTHARSFPGVL